MTLQHTSRKPRDPNQEPRPFCTTCLKSSRTCICAFMTPIETDVQFVFLMHRKEQRDRLGTGTGRLSHLMLKNSQLFVGQEFENMPGVQKILQDTAFFPCVLFPGTNSIDVSSTEGTHCLKNMATGKRLLVFILDGSWSCVRNIIRANPSIANLPHISFSTGRKSQFGFKRQPHETCLSTIEATHELLCLLANSQIAFSRPPGSQENLITIFEKFVAFQSTFAGENRITMPYKERVAKFGRR
jgi:DTW domain-containing protein YfiP